MKRFVFSSLQMNVIFLCGLLILLGLSGVCIATDSQTWFFCVLAVALYVAIFLVVSLVQARLLRRKHGEGEMTQSVSMDFLHSFSLPTLLLSEDGVIQWCNNAFSSLVEMNTSSLYGENFARFLDKPLNQDLATLSEQGRVVFSINSTPFELLPHHSATGSYICVMLDLSETARLTETLRMKNPLVIFLAVDNVSDDLSMTGAGYRTVLSKIYPLLEEWAGSLSAILREFGRDRYLLVLEEEKLNELRLSKFDILDRVRALSEGQVDVPVTISAGVACSDGTLHEKELASYQALDTALQRGGDQVVLRDREGTLEYYGGRTKTVQKRSRIKSRIVAEELKTLVLASEHVLIMGHAAADHDCVGACIGLARFCMEHAKSCNIVVRAQDPNLSPIMQALSPLEEYDEIFIDAATAQDMVGPSTLLLIADVNNPKQFESRDLYENSPNVVIIDHHRKTEEFVTAPKITYIDPACSSACEMISEILEQSLPHGSLRKEEAEIMFAGIMLDTKQFTRNTGTRTFAAALYLRGVDANPSQAQRLFSTDLGTMLSELEFEKNVVLYRDVIAIAASDRKATLQDKIAASRAADRLLNLKNIQATFVLCTIDGCTHISARSSGKVNVQLILERLQGGGYFDAAGAQLKGLDFTQALELLKQSIDAYLDEKA